MLVLHFQTDTAAWLMQLQCLKVSISGTFWCSKNNQKKITIWIHKNLGGDYNTGAKCQYFYILHFTRKGFRTHEKKWVKVGI